MAGYALEQLLALAHPLMPFVTEECWTRLPGSQGLMAVHPPAAAPGPRDLEAEAQIADVREVVTALRAYRSRRNLPPRAALVMDPAPNPAVAALDAVSAAGADVVPTLATALLGDGRSILLGPAAETVDPALERARLEEELATVESELERATRKLADARFVERAPAHLVEGEREKAARYAAEREALGSRIAALG